MRQTAKLTLGGRDFLMQELRDEDHERLDEYVQGRFIAAARASLNGSPVDGNEWRATMQLAMRESILLTWSRQPGLGLLLSNKRGLARMLHAGMDEKVNLQEVVDALKNGKDVQTAREEFLRINGMTAVAKEAPATDEHPTTQGQGGSSGA